MMNFLNHHIPALIISIPLLTAFSLMFIEKISKKLRNFFVFSAVTIILILVVILSLDILYNGIKVYVYGASSPEIALPSGYKFPIRIIFEIDEISIFMAIITAIISFVSVLYSLTFVTYIGKEEEEIGKYYSLLLLLITGIFGMVFTGDLFNFFVFLEISSISACALIAFDVKRKFSAEAAFKTIVLYSISALMFLLGVGILYGEYNALNIAFLSSKISFTILDNFALVLFIVSLGMKSGIVPMHFWLPDAYSQAPTPITMILVANTQASLYALFRICFTLFGLKMNTELVGLLIIILGLISMLVGVTMALIQKSIKRLIAYSAISQIGYMFLGLGVGLSVLGTPSLQEYGINAMKGAIFHIINDALSLSLLFSIVGVVIQKTGIRNIDELSGLSHRMKFTTIFFIIAASSISGLPPFNSFVSKLLIYESVYKLNPIFSVIALFSSIITLAIFVKVFQSIFLGPKLKFLDNVTEDSILMFIPMFILSSLIIIFGIFPNLLLDNLVEPAVFSLINKEKYIAAILGI